MISLIDHIKYLLMKNECVIVPGWGAFIAQYHPSVIDGGTYIGPSRGLSFNPAITHNDGMLAASIVRREDVSYEKANSIIENDVEYMRSQFEHNGRLEFDRIGTFTRNESGAIIFLPAQADISIANSYYSLLAPIDVAEHSISRSEAPCECENEIQFIPRQMHPVRRWMRVAASIAILVALCAVLSTPVSIQRDIVDYAFISTLSIQNPKAIELPAVDTEPHELIIAIPTDSAAVEDVVPAVEANKFRMDVSDKYFLIVASFESRRQAERYKAQFPDESLEIIESEWRYRVYAATGSSVNEARLIMDNEEFAALHPDAWVYKRR